MQGRAARFIRVKGVVQGVGFRPFVFRLASANGLAGWVRNAGEGVEIHLEGPDAALETFLHQLGTQAPPAAHISALEVLPAAAAGLGGFRILSSERQDRLSVRISPDLPVCNACLSELFDPADRRNGYPYINCTDCGPRYSIVLSLPYDRSNTTMKTWPLDRACAEQYGDPADRRFHAQPVACPGCGPHYRLRTLAAAGEGADGDSASIRRAAELLREGAIVAVKGLGGYHLACDARNTEAVRALRERKFRKEKPFAVMAQDLDAARSLVDLSREAEALLTSVARPIVLAPARAEPGIQPVAAGVAPDNDELGVMLPYTPVHHLLFAAGAPAVLVMTSANRSDEPIAYEDDDAFARLGGIADAFLVGERPIARRVDDSVVRAADGGASMLRRSRGYAPGAAARLPVDRPILAVGADLKNSVTLVVAGQAFVSQYIGDLDHYQAFQAFAETIRDLVSMYEVGWERLLVVHDCHPGYASTAHALGLTAAARRVAVQHHRAHIASVLAEREAWHERAIGIGLDGTGYGDDGTIWGGEIFVGSVAEGLHREMHLRRAALPGGDAAARFPVQAAAGFLAQIESVPDLTAAPFQFPERFQQALRLVRQGVRTFDTTSAGRLFDTAAALAGFTREISFEGQAAIWLEHLARRHSGAGSPYPFPLDGAELDFRPLLAAVIEDRQRGVDPSAIAHRFHRGVAQGLCEAVTALRRIHRVETVVLSGGVFQNQVLLRDLRALLAGGGCRVWTNHVVPPNDGGISLGQAALAAFASAD